MSTIPFSRLTDPPAQSHDFIKTTRALLDHRWTMGQFPQDFHDSTLLALQDSMKTADLSLMFNLLTIDMHTACLDLGKTALTLARSASNHLWLTLRNGPDLLKFYGDDPARLHVDVLTHAGISKHQQGLCKRAFAEAHLFTPDGSESQRQTEDLFRETTEYLTPLHWGAQNAHE